MWASAIAAVLLLAAPTDGPALFPIRQGGLYGFIDRTGAVVIAPRFERTFDSTPECPPFSEGLQPVRDGQRWGYIDRDGRLAISARFQMAHCFHEGLAAVRMDGTSPEGRPTRRYGFIDARGRWAIEPRFDSARAFSEGLAQVKVDHRYGYVDRRGRWAIEPRFRSSGACSDFAEGLACFSDGERWGFIDRRGRTAIPAQFEAVSAFAGGRAAAQEPGPFAPFGYVDRRGRFAFAERFHLAYGFSEGLARVQRERGGTAFIDRTGAAAFQFDHGYWAEPFSEGLAAVKVGRITEGEHQVGYVDRRGTFVIPPRFSGGGSFVNGLAAVRDCGGAGYIDTSGRVVWGLTTRDRPDTPPPPPARLTSEAVARAAGYPGALTITPSPVPPQCGPFGKALWGIQLSSADGTFVPVSIALVEGGTFLTDERTASIDRVLAEMTPAEQQASLVVRRVGGHPGGYSMVPGFGPGGAMHLTAIPSPDGAHELLVMVGISYEGEGPTVTDSTRPYLERLGKDPSAVTEAIAGAALAALYPPAGAAPAAPAPPR